MCVSIECGFGAVQIRGCPELFVFILNVYVGVRPLYVFLLNVYCGGRSLSCVYIESVLWWSTTVCVSSTCVFGGGPRSCVLLLNVYFGWPTTDCGPTECVLGWSNMRTVGKTKTLETIKRKPSQDWKKY